MKRIFCLLLVISILATSIITTCSLDAEHSQSDNLYTEEFKKYLNRYGLGLYEDYERWYIYSEYYYYYSDENNTDIPDWVLAYGSYYGVEPTGCYGVFDEYCLQEANCSVPFELGYYIYFPDENEFYTIQKAWSMGVVGIEKAFSECLVPLGIASFIGDADDDGNLSILDATFVQHVLAGLCVFNSNDDLTLHKKVTDTASLSYISDFDRDGNRTVMDATAIQKKLAKQ